MQPTPLRIGIMDSQREKLSATLPVLQLSVGARVGRGLLRFLVVSGIGALLVPVPLLHLCGAVVAVVVGPIVGLFAFLPKAKVGGGQITCPKCSTAVTVRDGVMGWPARVQCLACKSMLELTPAEVPS
jgi:hypothetical protein